MKGGQRVFRERKRWGPGKASRWALETTRGFACQIVADGSRLAYCMWRLPSAVCFNIGMKRRCTGPPGVAAHTPKSDCWLMGLMTGRCGSTSPSESCQYGAGGWAMPAQERRTRGAVWRL